MSKPSPPQPPDPREVARAQTATNIGTAIANSYLGNADVYGPLGNTIYTQTGSRDLRIDGKNYNIPLWSVQQNLTPDQRYLLDLQERAGQNLGQVAVNQSDKIGRLLNTTIDPSKLPAGYQYAPNAPTLRSATGLNPQLQTRIGADDFSADRRRVEEALMSRLTPQIDRDRDALQTRLANQGITQGSEAYQQGVDEQNRQVNDLRMQAVMAGGQEQSRLFGMDQAQGQFFNQATQQGVQNRLMSAEHENQVAQQNFGLSNEQMQNQQTLRQQGLQEIMSLRNQPISEISMLMNGGQPTLPQFQPFQAGHVSDVPVGQYYYQTAALENQQYQSQLGASGAAMGGMAGLFGNLFGMFSDRRLKENAKIVCTLPNGLNIYLFQYKTGGPFQLGLMADEVEQVHPEAVSTVGPHGFKVVRYDLAVEPI
jgi:hypothetical protein